MSFDVGWLDLREAADRAARDPRLLAMARDHATAEEDAPLIVDLGAGTGATLRAFGLPAARWHLIDSDASLVGEARRRHGVHVETTCLDLRDVDALPISGARLVTASALIDLVSATWIDALADRLAGSGTGFYAALSYDGSMRWTPADHDDDAVTAAFNGHQAGNKGFGPALGPSGALHVARAFRERGYRVDTAPSPWLLGDGSEALRARLLGGVALAAIEAGCGAGAWLERRLAEPSAEAVVGHVDVLALPPD